MDSEMAYSGKERASVFISTLFGYGLDFYNILIISFLMSAIQKSLGITLTQAGVITSVTLAGSVFGGVLFGWIGDRVGRKTSLLLTLGLFSLGALLSAFSWNFESLLFFRIVTGIGLGGEWGAGVVLFNEVWDRNRRGFGSALIQAASSVGIGAASVVSVWALGSFSPDWGWRIALLTGASPIILMVYVRFWMPESRLWLEYEQLRKEGVRADAIHGDLRQSNRERTLKDFSEGKLPTLVATDVAARGLDIDLVDVVVHFDPPEDHKAYLHRSGRTARAGEAGLVVTLVQWNQVLEIERIQTRIGLRSPIVEIFSNDSRLKNLAAWNPLQD